MVGAVTKRVMNMRSRLMKFTDSFGFKKCHYP